MALPLHLLTKLKVDRSEKLALAGIFSLGFIIIIFAVVRVVETSASIHHVNPLWLALWSGVEAGVGKISWFCGVGIDPRLADKGGKLLL